MIAAMAAPTTTLAIGGRDVVISSPDKVYWPQAGITKMELVQYYLAVADGALRGIRGRPMVLRRFVHGVEVESFFQKRVGKHPEWMRTATLSYASGGVAEEIVVDDVAGLAWVVNLGCVEMHAHPVRVEDLEHPDELRIDLDPVQGVGWREVVEVARVAHGGLDDLGYTGFPKTTGSRGVHIWVRIERKWKFDEVKKAGIALAHEIERRAPTLATTRWQKEERHGVLIDYNQNAFDRTTAAAYSVRPVPDARVSMPLTWNELYACDPGDFTLKTVPALFGARGDAHKGIDARAFTLDKLLAMAASAEPASKAAKKAAAKSPRPRKLPVIVVARSKSKAEALAGLERWRARHPEVSSLLAAEDVLIDAMRGRSSAWYRIRINLKSVPAHQHPPPEPADPDYDAKAMHDE